MDTNKPLAEWQKDHKASKAKTIAERERQLLKLQESMLLAELAKRKKAAEDDTVSSERFEPSERFETPEDFDGNRKMKDDEIPF